MSEHAAPEPLRLVLFGPAGAGKSSLLGALPQAAEAQPHLLHGRIADPSPNLLDLRRRVYDHGPPAAGGEAVPYSFQYEPQGPARRRGAVVLDCDGRVAGALYRDPSPAGDLLHADAVVLAVDAAAPPERLDAEFGEFDDFLRRMEERRGTRTDVGGLPVFLVLTKCDLLARTGETAADWLERIEERKREVGARFHDFLAARDRPNQPQAFGRIRLHLWATAIRRPPLAGAAASPNDPYGVAELFRQCLDRAAAFHEERERSAHRLVQMTLAAAGGVVLLLAAAGSMVWADSQRRTPSALEMRAEAMRREDPAAPAARLRGPLERLRLDLHDWTDVRDAPDFGGLPPDLQEYVKGRASELEVYVPWLEGLETAPGPRDALTEEDLRAIRARLDGPLAPPRPGWEATEAGRLWAEASAQTDALLRGIDGLRRWYDRAYDVADALWTFGGYDAGGPDWNGWARQAGRLLDPTAGEPSAVSPEDAALLWAAGARSPAVPGAACPWAALTLGPGGLRRLFVPGVSPPMTWAELAEFGTVASARKRWEAAREQLRRLRDVGTALGLIEGAPGEPDLLSVPADGLTLEQAAERYQLLQQAYPNYAAAFTRGDALPSAVTAGVRERAKRNFDRLLEAARAAVLARLRAAPPGEGRPAETETPARWAAVREWLRDPRELAGWRGLAFALARLADPTAPDPVDALADFLDQKSFLIDIKGFTLVVPDALDADPAPGQPLRVHFAPAAGAAVDLVFPPAGKGNRVGGQPALEYYFEPADQGGKLPYAPGDEFYAELPLAGGKVLRWDRSRSALYRFEVLREEPGVVPAGDAGAGERKAAEGVRLRPRPDGGVPAVPALMPWVDLQ